MIQENISDFKFPNIKIILGYISGLKQEFTYSEVLRRFNSKELNYGLCLVEFKYFVPILNKDLEVVPVESSVRYVVGASIKLSEFKKLVEMQCLKLNIEQDFKEKIKEADSVCLVRSMNVGICPQQVYVLDMKTKIFDSIPELINESKKFIITLNKFYSLDELESYIDIKLL